MTTSTNDADAAALAAVKKHLHIERGDNDGRLLATLRAAEAAIGQHVGPLGDQVVTQQVTSRGSAVLDQLPVHSVTTVRRPAGTEDLTGWALDASTGIVTGLPTGPLVITYRAGWRAVGELPADLDLAVLEMTRHLWSESQRGGSNRPAQGSGSAGAPVLGGFLIPNAVAALLAPYREQAVG